MFVGVCSASAALGRHEAIFMSHPTTILNTCQQRKYYLKREKDPSENEFLLEQLSP